MNSELHKVLSSAFQAMHDIVPDFLCGLISHFEELDKLPMKTRHDSAHGSRVMAQPGPLGI